LQAATLDVRDVAIATDPRTLLQQAEQDRALLPIAWHGVGKPG
jgi:hypothetical protein